MKNLGTDRQRRGQRWSVLTDEEKTKIMRVIDEYDFVSKVLKYKATMMPEDLVRELAQQNDITREIIAMSLPLASDSSV